MKAVALAMGVATVVLYYTGNLDQGVGMSMLGIGLAILAVSVISGDEENK